MEIKSKPSRFLAIVLSSLMAGLLSLAGFESPTPRSGLPSPPALSNLLQESSPAPVWWEPPPLRNPPPRPARWNPPHEEVMELRGELEEGENLAMLLKRLEVSRRVRQQILDGFRDTLDFRRMRPGDAVLILLEGNGDLISCTFRSNPAASFILTKTPEGWRVNQDGMSLLSQTVRISGTIRHGVSLAEAFEEAGEDGSLARAFADLMAPLINLDHDAAGGDRFGLLVDKYYQREQFIGYGRILNGRYEPAAGGERLEAVYLEAGEKSGYFTPEGSRLTVSLLLPIPTASLASGYSPERQHPILKMIKPHLGIDLAAPEGTPVLAAEDGEVLFIGYNGGFGKQIVLRHADGFRTHYGHLSRYQSGIKKGDRVTQREIIGYVGSTGLATGPHLDYRVERHGSFLDPLEQELLLPPALGKSELLRLRLTAEIYDLFVNGKGQPQVLAVRELNLAGPDLSLLQSFL